MDVFFLFYIRKVQKLVTFLSQSAFMLLPNYTDFQCVMMFLAIGCFCSLFVAWCLVTSSSLSVGDGFGRSPTLIYRVAATSSFSVAHLLSAVLSFPSLSVAAA